MFSLLGWKEIDERVCGSRNVDVEALKEITEYSCCEKDCSIIKKFWSVFEAFSEEDKQGYLRFVWGRQRLPKDIKTSQIHHRIRHTPKEEKDSLPKADVSCF